MPCLRVRYQTRWVFTVWGPDSGSSTEPALRLETDYTKASTGYLMYSRITRPHGHLKNHFHPQNNPGLLRIYPTSRAVDICNLILNQAWLKFSQSLTKHRLVDMNGGMFNLG